MAGIPYLGAVYEVDILAVLYNFNIETRNDYIGSYCRSELSRRNINKIIMLAKYNDAIKFTDENTSTLNDIISKSKIEGLSLSTVVSIINIFKSIDMELNDNICRLNGKPLYEEVIICVKCILIICKMVNNYCDVPSDMKDKYADVISHTASLLIEKYTIIADE